MEKRMIGIEVHPTETPKPAPVKAITDIPEKLKQIMKKYKYNWRINMLSKPTRITPKVDIEAKTTAPSSVQSSATSTECPMRIDHLSRPPIR